MSGDTRDAEHVTKRGRAWKRRSVRKHNMCKRIPFSMGLKTAKRQSLRSLHVQMYRTAAAAAKEVRSLLSEKHMQANLAKK